MLDAIAAHIEFVQGDHILGEVVPDAVVDPKFPVDGFTDKVDLLVPGLADGNGIAPAKKLQIDDVLQDQVEKIVERCIIWSI